MHMIDIYFVSRDMNRDEKWHPHDVIPMHMSHKDMKFFDSLLHRGSTSLTKTGAHIDINRLASMMNLCTRRIATEDYRMIEPSVFERRQKFMGASHTDFAALNNSVFKYC